MCLRKDYFLSIFLFRKRFTNYSTENPVHENISHFESIVGIGMASQVEVNIKIMVPATL